MSKKLTVEVKLLKLYHTISHTWTKKQRKEFTKTIQKAVKHGKYKQ